MGLFVTNCLKCFFHNVSYFCYNFFQKRFFFFLQKLQMKKKLIVSQKNIFRFFCPFSVTFFG